MTQQERVSLWRGRIKRSRTARDKWVEDVVTPNLIATFEKDGLKPKRWSDEDIWVNIPLIFASIRAQIPTLLYANPKYTVTARQPQIIETPEGPNDVSWERAQGAEEWLNLRYKKTNGDQQARLAILWAFLAYGVVKTGFTTDMEGDKRRGIVKVDEDGLLEIGPDGLPILESGEWLRDENGEVVYSNDLPVPHPGGPPREEFFIDAVDPRMMLHDPDGGEDIAQHRWVAEEWVKPLWEVQEDIRIPAGIRRKIKASEVADDYEGERGNLWGPKKYDDPVSDSDFGRVRGVDIYDRVERKYLVLLDSTIEGYDDRFVIDTPIPDGMLDGHPYSFLKFNDKLGQFYPHTEVEVMLGQAIEYSMTRSQMAIHGESAKNRILAAPGAFPVEDAETEKEKFANGPANTIIEANAQKITPFAPAQMDQSFYAREGYIRGTFDQISGVGAAMRGSGAADTATEASIIKSESDIRTNDRRDNQVQKFLQEIGYKLLVSGRANAQEPIFVAKADGFLQVNPVSLDIEAEVDLAVGSTMAKNDARVSAQILQFLNVVAQSPHILLADPLIERALDSMNIDPHLAGALKQAGQQMLQAMQGQQGSAAGLSPAQQELSGSVGGQPNAAGGAPTGAMLN